ncbi:hypothetical protein F4804DRAFT_303022 [Jackrogersella minutella]|nr:hypothetical protein F4804DRAFT_303022 [Jackrogersella minutella]
MLRRLLLGSSVLIAALALFLSQWPMSSTPYIPSTIGRNNTVLFIANFEFGLSNVHLATVHALLERYPDIHVHFASFAPMASRLERISEHGRQKTPSAQEVVFHALPAELSFATAMGLAGRTPASIIHRPGRVGIDTVCKDMSFLVSPWSGEVHMAIYQRLSEITDEVDPAVVVTDIFFRPAIDAIRKQNRLHAFVVPNLAIDTFPLEQPYLGWLWKYPVMGTGIPYPVPWSRILENIYLNLQYFYTLIFMPHFRETQKFLVSKGLTDPVNFFKLHGSNVPWFTQSLLEASIPLDVIPQNVTYTGPISFSLSTVEEESPDLAQWLARAPTVLVNLGSFFLWSEGKAAAMAQAIADLLLEETDLQVLWKFRKGADDATGETYSDEFLAPLRPFFEDGRVKMESWLAVEPTALLETGHIIASVHHGGAGCFNEALGTGVPQILLPQWLDHYSLTQSAQYIGVGIWACQETSPLFTTECLRDALSVVTGKSDMSIAMREKAKRIADTVQRNPGRYIVAREIAKLAASGHRS